MGCLTYLIIYTAEWRDGNASGDYCVLLHLIAFEDYKCIILYTFITHAKNLLAFHASQLCSLQIFMLFQQVSHGAIQFTAYEELRKVVVDFKSKKSRRHSGSADSVLVFLCSCS